jgi:hypothetical protein
VVLALFLFRLAFGPWLVVTILIPVTPPEHLKIPQSLFRCFRCLLAGSHSALEPYLRL